MATSTDTPAPKPKARMGRPSLYSDELADQICKALVDADCGLQRLCETRDDFPSPATVWRWQSENTDFREKVTRAKEYQQERMIYDGIEGIEDADPEGRSGNARVAKAKASADARFKLAAKVAPRKYGERIQHDVTARRGDDAPAQESNPLDHLEPGEQAEWLRLTQLAAQRAARKQLGPASSSSSSDGGDDG